MSVFLQLHRQKAELKRSNAALFEFARAVSHGLQAPVRHIRIWTELLIEEDGAELSDDARMKLKKL